MYKRLAMGGCFIFFLELVIELNELDMSLILFLILQNDLETSLILVGISVISNGFRDISKSIRDIKNGY